MIKQFRCKETEKVWKRKFSKKLPEAIQQKARRKLLMLNAASTLEDLQVPPNNRLERLTGNRKGSFSIRINDQWRICFKYQNGEAYEVEIVDYH